MTREEAIKIIRDTYHTDEEIKALESLIPELRESEDERVRKQLVELVEQFAQGKFKHKMYTWLEKQKEQKPAEWSEEDEKMRNTLIRRLQYRSGDTRTDTTSPNITYFEEIEWLKSLRPQPHWKPSEEQMRQLCDAANLKAKISDDIYVFPELRSLYYDIQKLTEK